MELTGKELRQMYVSRLGKILSNLALVCVLFALGGVLGYVLLAAYYVIMFAIVVATLGLILLAGNPFNGANAAWEWINNVYSNVTIYIAPVALVISVLAIWLLVKDKKENHTGRIGMCGTVVLIALIVIIVKIVQMAKGGE